MKVHYYSFVKTLEGAKNIPLLMLRIVLAYGFYGPAMMKWHHIEHVTGLFINAGIPAPYFSVYLVASIETFGSILLLLGLATRFITVPLMVVMIVAILTTAHFGHGFQAGNNGFEIPLFYLTMLFTLFIYGPGKISFDHLVKRGQYSNKFSTLD